MPFPTNRNQGLLGKWLTQVWNRNIQNELGTLYTTWEQESYWRIPGSCPKDSAANGKGITGWRKGNLNVAKNWSWVKASMFKFMSFYSFFKRLSITFWEWQETNSLFWKLGKESRIFSAFLYEVCQRLNNRWVEIPLYKITTAHLWQDDKTEYRHFPNPKEIINLALSTNGSQHHETTNHTLRTSQQKDTIQDNRRSCQGSRASYQFSGKTEEHVYVHSEYTLSPKSRPRETHRWTAPGSLTGKLQGKERDGGGRDTDHRRDF